MAWCPVKCTRSSLCTTPETQVAAGIPDALLPMMNALRMVWIISRHYSDDEKMGNLFRRIANMLANRVQEHIDLKTIFDIPAADALSLISTASLVLSEWRETYMKVREHIELSGQHARWEFPKTMLFERTGHIGEILTELKFMVETVHDFFKFLGPELKAVTGDTEERTCTFTVLLATSSNHNAQCDVGAGD